MALTEYPGLTVTYEANAALENKWRFGKLTSGKLALCGASEQAIGVIREEFDSGEQASCTVEGIVKVEASAAITVGAKVSSAANGKAVATSALSATVPTGAIDVTSTSAQPAMTIAGGYLPQPVLGVALTAASDDGDIILVKLSI